MKKISVLMLTGLLVAGTLFAGCATGSAGSGTATAEAVSVAESEPETETETETEPEVEMTSELQETEDDSAPAEVEEIPEETPEVTEAPVEETPAEAVSEVEEEPVTEEEDPYVGSYTGNGAAILIDRDADTYYVQIRWSIDETNSAEWTMSGSFDANGTLAYSDATKVATVTDETDASTSEQVYTGGSGSITVQNGALTWTDNQEGIASGITYTKV